MSNTNVYEPERRGGHLPQEGGSLEQHSLGYSIVLHLLPGVALMLFIVLAAPVVRGWGFPAIFALFIGIPLVIVPLELATCFTRPDAPRGGGRWQGS